MKVYKMALAVLMLTLVSIGAVAQVKVVFGEKGEEKFPGTGGTITVSQDTKGDEVTVTLTVTPDKGYTITKGDIKVYATYPPSGTRTPEIADDLTLYFNGSEKEDVKDPSEKRDYTFTISSNFGAWVKEAKFQSSGKKGGDEPTREDYSGTYFIKSEMKKQRASFFGGFALLQNESKRKSSNLDRVAYQTRGQPSAVKGAPIC